MAYAHKVVNYVIVQHIVMDVLMVSISILIILIYVKDVYHHVLYVLIQVYVYNVNNNII